MQRHVQNRLATAIIEGRIVPGETVDLDADGDELLFGQSGTGE
jgi:ATP-dependent Clp protease ATP-binding subunit ClpA